MQTNDYLAAFYAGYDEEGRLLTRQGHVEYATTMRYIHHYLTPGMRVLEIGAGTGRYSHALAQEGCAVLLITHDLSLAVRHADTIAVFYAGTTVEVTPAEDFRAGEGNLRHPYTKALWRAMPENGFEPIPGTQPYAGTVASGCPFADRCPLRDDDCTGDIPTRSIRGGEVRCVHAE